MWRSLSPGPSTFSSNYESSALHLCTSRMIVYAKLWQSGLSSYSWIASLMRINGWCNDFNLSVNLQQLCKGCSGLISKLVIWTIRPTVASTVYATSETWSPEPRKPLGDDLISWFKFSHDQPHLILLGRSNPKLWRAFRVCSVQGLGLKKRKTSSWSWPMLLKVAPLMSMFEVQLESIIWVNYDRSSNKVCLGYSGCEEIAAAISIGNSQSGWQKSVYEMG
jgi:hypothetical protein